MQAGMKEAHGTIFPVSPDKSGETGKSGNDQWSNSASPFA
jgi:hypothetical protein